MKRTRYRIAIVAFIGSILVSLLAFVTSEKISDKRLCADRECQTIISKARTLARHKPRDPAFLAFERGDIIDVFSKSAGNRQDLWGGKVNDKYGYFPRSFVREYKVVVPNPEHVIETEDHIPIEDKIMGRGKAAPPPPSNPTQPPPSKPPAQEQEQPPNNQPPAQNQASVTQADKPAPQEQHATKEEAVKDETELDETEVGESEEEEEPVEDLPSGAPDKPADESKPDTPIKEQNTGKQEGERNKSPDEGMKEEKEVDETEVIDELEEEDDTDLDGMDYDEDGDMEDADDEEDVNNEGKTEGLENNDGKTDRQENNDGKTDGQEINDVKTNKQDRQENNKVNQDEQVEGTKDQEVEAADMLKDKPEQAVEEKDHGGSKPKSDEAKGIPGDPGQTKDETEVDETDLEGPGPEEGGSLFGSMFNESTTGDETNQVTHEERFRDTDSDVDKAEDLVTGGAKLDDTAVIDKQDTIHVEKSDDSETINQDHAEDSHVYENQEHVNSKLAAKDIEIEQHKQMNTQTEMNDKTFYDDVDDNTFEDDDGEDDDVDDGTFEDDDSEDDDEDEDDWFIREENHVNVDAKPDKMGDEFKQINTQAQIDDVKPFDKGEDKTTNDEAESKMRDDIFQRMMDEASSDEKIQNSKDNLPIKNKESEYHTKINTIDSKHTDNVQNGLEDLEKSFTSNDRKEKADISIPTTDSEPRVGETNRNIDDLHEDSVIEGRQQSTDDPKHPTNNNNDIKDGDTTKEIGDLDKLVANDVKSIESDASKRQDEIDELSEEVAIKDGMTDAEDKQLHPKKASDSPDVISENIETHGKAIISPFGKQDGTQEETKQSEDQQKEEDKPTETKSVTDETELDDKEETESEKPVDGDTTGGVQTAGTDTKPGDEHLKFVNDAGEVEEEKPDVGGDDAGSLLKEMEQMANSLPTVDKQVAEQHGDFPPVHPAEEDRQSDLPSTNQGGVPLGGVTEVIENAPSQIMDTQTSATQTDAMPESQISGHQTQMDGTVIPGDVQETAPVQDVSAPSVIRETPSQDEIQLSVQTSFESTPVLDTQELRTNAVTSGLDTTVVGDVMKTEIDATTVENTHEATPVSSGTQSIPDTGVMIDGTLFPPEYFDDQPTTTQFANTQTFTNIQPTATQEVHVHTEIGNEINNQQTTEPVAPEPDHVNAEDQGQDKTNLILDPTSVIEDQSVVNSETKGNVQVLGTSFSYVTPSVDESASEQTTESFSTSMDVQSDTSVENVTVASDHVEEQVQPSLDQNEYQPGHFVSRKPLSTGSSFFTGASAETQTQGHTHEGHTEEHIHEGDKEMDNAKLEDEREEAKRRREQDIRNRRAHQQQQHQEHHHHEEQQQETMTEPHHHQEQHQEEKQQHQQQHQETVTEIPVEGLPPVPPTEHHTGSYTDDIPDDYTIDKQDSRTVPDPSLDDETVSKTGYLSLQTYEPQIKALIDMLPPLLQSVLEQEPLGMSPSLTVLVSLLSTVIVLLVSCIACSCKGEKKSGQQQQEALGIIRGLEEQLFIATKEKENLEDEMQTKEQKLEELKLELSTQQTTAGNLESDISTYRDKLTQIDKLKKNILLLEQEISDYKHEVGELNTDNKSRTDTIKKLEQAVQNQVHENEGLEARLNELQLTVTKSNKLYTEKEEELKRTHVQIDNLSQQAEQLTTRKTQLEEEAESWSEKVKELDEQIEQYSTDSRRMQEDLAFKENELDVLRDCFLQVKAFQGEDEDSPDTDEIPDIQEKLKSMMDVSRVNAALKAVEDERDVLQNKLQIEVDSRQEMEDQIQQLKRKMETNQTDKMKAERQCQEAQTKLEVLSKYFKEKETELTRQLGEQEVLKNQNIHKLKTSDGFTQDLLKENEVYKNQVDDLKSEISKAERDFRSQIATIEKKAHENWLNTRAAERELKESRHECGMLRQKLTELERKLIPPGVIRPITHRGIPPPGMMNGPPPPGPPERPGSRGSVQGHVTPRLRDDDYRASPGLPMDRRMPPGPRPPHPIDPRSPPPYAIRPPFPPPGRSPPHFDRFPPPLRGARPPFPRPPPPFLHSPPRIGSPDFDDSSNGPGMYPRPPPPGTRDRGTQRHQSQILLDHHQMVLVLKDYTERLKVMTDKTGSTEEKRQEVIDLPSLGLGRLLSNAEDARNLMSQIRNSNGGLLLDPSVLPKVPQQKPKLQTSQELLGLKTVLPKPKTGNEPRPGTSRGAENRPMYGKTTPFSTSTINFEQLTDPDSEDDKNVLFKELTSLPKLSVKTAEYSRFRYASERQDKGKKKRQYEMDEEKRFMADVKVTNHTGPGTVFIHCTDNKGHLHPYYLDGEDCCNGVYYKRHDFSPRSPVLKVLKTTVIQPKAKEYEKSIRDQKQFLSENKASDGGEKTSVKNLDKQCVHFHVKVLLDEGQNGIYLNTITEAIRNKKDGTEFKIHALTPCSAKANGDILPYLGQKVFILVTQETAFPKDIAVVFKKEDPNWEHVLRGDAINIIKKAYIEFTPPPYQDTSITENVEVQVCIRDRTTGKETPPATFLYIGDEYGAIKRSKKRKREDIEELSMQYSSPESPNVQAQRSIINALVTGKSSNPRSSGEFSSSNSSAETTPHGSLGYIQDNSMMSDENSLQSVQNHRDVSLESRRASMQGVNQSIQGHSGYGLFNAGPIDTGTQSFVAPSPTPIQIGTSSDSTYGNIFVTQSVSAHSTASLVNNLPGQSASIQHAGHATNNSTSSEYNPQVIKSLSPDMLLRLFNLIQSNKVTLIAEAEKIFWERINSEFISQEQAGTSQPVPQQTTPAQQPADVPLVESLTDLPALPPNLQYAIIQGQIMVVQNDLPETNQQGQGEQMNIAGQDVIIQQMEPQQPTPEPSLTMTASDINKLIEQVASTSSASTDVITESIDTQQPTPDKQSFTMTASDIQKLLTQVNSNAEVASTSSASRQPRQPPPEFWRAITGTSSNLDDDDDVEIDSGINPNAAKTIDMESEATEMEVDGGNAEKTHGMKLRGKKINFKSALREYEDALYDINNGGSDTDGSFVLESDDNEKNNKEPKRNYNSGMGKKSRRQGKAMYEDGEGETEVNKTKTSPATKRKHGKGTKGKDLKLIKKMALEESDDNSEGFEYNSD